MLRAPVLVDLEAEGLPLLSSWGLISKTFYAKKKLS